MKSFFRLLLRLCFGFRAYGTEVLNSRGPVLLVPNHVSWLDWLFLYVLLEDDWKFVATTTTADLSWIHRKIVLGRRTFPIDPHSAYAVRSMAEFLEAGGRLVLFAEGRISVSGELMKLFDGTGFLIRKTNAKVVTCYLRGAKRLWWVRHGGWRKMFPHVTAHFSPVLQPPAFEGLHHSEERTRLTQWIRDRMVAQHFEVEHAFGAQNVLSAVAETASQLPGRVALQDINGALTYRRLMVGASVLGGMWDAVLGTPRGKRVGVLLPNVNGMPVCLLSLWRAGRIPAVLNFSSGPSTMLACVQLAGLTEVVTSRAFVDKAKLNLQPLADAGVRIVWLEDVRARVTIRRKLGALVRHALAPGREFLAACAAGAGDTAVVLFTSGSESAPKGVELTHQNILANIRQALAVMDVMDDDRFFNALPLFHSFGLTAGTLLPLVRGCFTFLYPSPLHYRVIPAMVYETNCTVFMATNTFLNGYARKAHPYDFRTVRYLMAGAEKVQAATLETWARRFGVRVLEGYGATECSPVISVNTGVEPRVGTAGRFLPGIEHRLEPVDGVTDGGRLLVRGPNVMKGYLNPDADAQFKALGGWYDTGDIASIDAEGFVQLKGRLKRFAKVSGEMVSLTAVEDALAGAFSRLGVKCEVAVVARPDAEKGEVLIAVTNEPRLQLAEVRAVLREKGLSNLAAPRELRVVQAIPKLGTGKVNHRALNEGATE